MPAQEAERNIHIMGLIFVLSLRQPVILLREAATKIEVLFLGDRPLLELSGHF